MDIEINLEKTLLFYNTSHDIITGKAGEIMKRIVKDLEKIQKTT